MVPPPVAKNCDQRGRDNQERERERGVRVERIFTRDNTRRRQGKARQGGGGGGGGEDSVGSSTPYTAPPRGFLFPFFFLGHFVIVGETRVTFPKARSGVHAAISANVLGPRAGRCGEQVTWEGRLPVFPLSGSDVDGTYGTLVRETRLSLLWERFSLSQSAITVYRVGCLCVMLKSVLDNLGDTYHSPCLGQGWVGKLPRHI
jgi:hypothetical protein